MSDTRACPICGNENWDGERCLNCGYETADALKECSKCGMSWEAVWSYDYSYCPYCGRRIENADE